MKRRRFSPPPAGDAVRAAYAAVPYPGDAFPQTHPRSLAAQAALFGLDPAPPARSRVLEVGCADGGNAIGIAAGLPDAEVVGVDLDGEAIERGRELAGAAGVGNVRLEQADLMTLEPRALGRFEVVIAHGVYSWVPEGVRDRVLALAAGCLAPHGVLFLSYNTLPGGHLRAIVREVLLGETAGTEDARERLAAARATLDRLAGLDAYGGRLGEYVERLRVAPDALVFHDEMAPVNEPVTLGALARHAARHGLRWMSEAQLSESAAGALADGFDLGEDDRLAREERLDTLTLRMHRQALLCRAERRVREAPDAAAVAGLVAATRLHAARTRRTVTELRHPDGGSVKTDHPGIAEALTALGDAWPAAVPVAELPSGGDRAVQRALLSAHARGLVDVVAQAPAVAPVAPERPRVSALARAQAARDGRVTTGWHATVRISDELSRRLIVLLDGTRDRPALVAALERTPDGAARRDLASGLDRVLGELAALAVLEP